ncbi:MAG TPA: DUF3313 family protein, partial [Caulobacteraceae bacterium]|nr:DUF3313 family protein [Caulobacteraceae bacterium]
GAMVGPAARAARPPAEWDGLSLVDSKRLDRVYLLPGADFRPYTKVIIDPTEVAFKKNWIRDYNSSSMGSSKRLTQQHADEIQKEVSSGMAGVFAEAYRKAGYQVVQAPGPDVLRVRTGVLNLSVTAPDVMSAGRSRTWSQDSGEATLVVEARDSQTGALLGRALDRRSVGDSRPYLRNSVTNRADFRRMFGSWADASVEGVGKLKAMSPVSAGRVVAEQQ